MIQTNRICGKGRVKLDSEGLGPTQRALVLEREKVKKSPASVSTKSKVIYHLISQKINIVEWFPQCFSTVVYSQLSITQTICHQGQEAQSILLFSQKRKDGFIYFPSLTNPKLIYHLISQKIKSPFFKYQCINYHVFPQLPS